MSRLEPANHRGLVRPWLLCAVLVVVLVAVNGALFAVDPSVLGGSVERAEAMAELDEAKAEVRSAQARVRAARAKIDAFLTKHFDLSGKLDHPPLPQAQLKVATSGDDAQKESLESQLNELHAKRARLLVTLTEVHPEVVDVDSQIATVEAQIKTLTLDDQLAAEEHGVAGHADDEAWREFLRQQKKQSEADAAEYERLFDRWEAAEKTLEKARTAETLAAERLATVPLVAAAAAPLSAAPTVSKTPRQSKTLAARKVPTKKATPSNDGQDGALATAPTMHSTDDPTGAQTVVFVALAAALAIAALAAVRLARASNNPLFASADEAAAALAIPVVGIVPASYGRVMSQVSLRKSVVLVVQVVLAILVFVVVAYAIEHAEDAVRLFSNPVTTLRSWLGL